MTTTKYVATVTCTEDPCTYCGASDDHRPAQTYVMRRDVFSPPTFFATAEEAMEHAQGMNRNVYGASTHRAAVVAVEVAYAIGDGGTEGERAAVAEMLGVPASSAAWDPRKVDADDPSTWRPNTSITLLRSTDPEPPVGTKVRTSEGSVYRRSSLDDRRCWFAEGDDDDPESWTRVAGNYGPVMLVED